MDNFIIYAEKTGLNRAVIAQQYSNTIKRKATKSKNFLVSLVHLENTEERKEK